MAAYRLDIKARRNDSWSPDIELTYQGPALPLTGASIRLEIRQYPGQGGDPNLVIPSVNYSDALVSGTPDEDDEVRMLTLRPFLNWGPLSTLPGINTPEAGDSQTFYYDAVILYPDNDVREAILEGAFVIVPGVTRPF